jgi:hypothetical protein
MMKALAIAAAVALTAVPARSQGSADPKGVLAIAKITGACGILDSMIHFQKTTRMPGGDEFVTRFWTVESARLGISVEQLSSRCNRATKAYNEMWNEFSH